jgi:hypothetical protein
VDDRTLAWAMGQHGRGQARTTQVRPESPADVVSGPPAHPGG